MSWELFSQAVALHRQGRLEDAGRLCLRVLEHASPADSEARYLLAFLRYQQGRVPDALQAVEGLLSRDPGLAKALLLHGILLHGVGRPVEALRQLTAAAARDPANAEIWYSRGVLLAGMARPEEALTSFDKALAIRPTPDCWNYRARLLQDLGRFADAIAACDRALALAPNSAVAWNERGNALLRLDRLTESLASYDKALALHPDQALGWTNRGAVLQALNRHQDAIASYDRALQVARDHVPAVFQRAVAQQCLSRLVASGERMAAGLAEAEAGFRQAIALKPDLVEAHTKLADVLREQGKLDASEASYRRAMALQPDEVGAHIGLGNVLSDRGDMEGAIACYRRALALNPHIAETHNNLGNALNDMGRLDEAMASYREALALMPGMAQARSNIAVILWNQGDLKEAERIFRQIVQDEPGYAPAWDKLAALLSMQGQVGAATEIICRSLDIQQSRESRRMFVDVIRSSRAIADNGAVRTYMTRALTEPWGRPSDLAQGVVACLKTDPHVGPCIARAAAAWPDLPSAQHLYGAEGPAAVADNVLLNAFLTSVPNPDADMERFLTAARHLLLEAARDGAGSVAMDVLAFHAAIAAQCFINEYVFCQTEDEARGIEDVCARLTTALEAGASVPVLWVAAIAAFKPLGSVPLAARLLDRQWPDAIAALLVQQIVEPRTEAALRADLPRLTPIAEGVSSDVRALYEENPYPRWVRTPPGDALNDAGAYWNRKFPLARFKRRTLSPVDVLIAGCGTGQHSIEVARRFRDGRVLAIDLSLSSLVYAQRKTAELGLTNIEYAQADILQLGGLGRSFDVIESAGVLHHMADPFAGWNTLLSLLRPGGFMLIGLYSETARRDILRARHFIATRGFAPVPEQIRQCRQEIMAPGDGLDLASLLTLSDFYSISTCRDLLFHVQESYLSLAEIETFLRDKGLTLLGFEINPGLLHAYRQRFPNDPAATDMGQWALFEQEHPDSFAGMYQFWVQKPG